MKLDGRLRKPRIGGSQHGLGLDEVEHAQARHPGEVIPLMNSVGAAV
jgi:hypothetical protein